MIFFGNSSGVYMVRLNVVPHTAMLLRKTNRLIQIQFDRAEMLLFMMDSDASGTVTMIRRNLSTRDVKSITLGLLETTEFVIDASTKTLYVTGIELPREQWRIRSFDYNGENSKDVLVRNSKPSALVVDHEKRFLFFAEEGRIYRLNLAVTGMTTEMAFGVPPSLDTMLAACIDVYARRMYYIDMNMVEYTILLSTNLSGGEMQELATDGELATGCSMHGSDLYFITKTNGNEGKLWRANTNDFSDITLLLSSPSVLVTVAAG